MLPYDDEGPLAYGRRGALGGQNDGRHPAKPARSCGSRNSISARTGDTPNPVRGVGDAAPYV